MVFWRIIIKGITCIFPPWAQGIPLPENGPDKERRGASAKDGGRSIWNYMACASSVRKDRTRKKRGTARRTAMRRAVFYS